MSWTYDITKIATSKKDQIRFAIGDTIQAEPLLQDEEIEYVISTVVDTKGIVAACYDAIASKFAREASNALGPAKIEAQQKYDHYKELAKEANNKNLGLNAPTAGGIEDEPINTALKPGIFSIGMMDAISDEE